MSTNVFPTLPGQYFEITRTPQFKTRRQVSVSGKEVRIADWSTPRYTWAVTFNALRQGTFNLSALTEFSTLEGFFETLQGGFDSFLYTDADDNAVTDQGVGTGDGVTTTFQLARAFGGAVVPVLAPNTITNVKVNGTIQTPVTNYSVSSWGSTTPGVITFTGGHIPPAAQAITWTGTYYFPVRFDDDTLDFKKILQNVYELQKMSFTSIK